MQQELVYSELIQVPYDFLFHNKFAPDGILEKEINLVEFVWCGC